METRLLRSIIVDDERPSREVLSTYLREYCPQVEIVAESDSVKTAYNAILKSNPELVFLDIEMPNGNGFDLLKMFKSPDFKVIFITAFSDYAIRAFRFSAIDYLLKPIKVDELKEAVAKVSEAFDNKMNEIKIETLLKNISSDARIDNLVISDIKGFTVIRMSQIIKCEGEGYCTQFYLTGGRKIISSKNLKYYEKLLAPNQIIKVHHSSLINLQHVEGYTRQGEILLSEDLKCPLGNNFKQGFLERFGKLK